MAKISKKKPRMFKFKFFLGPAIPAREAGSRPPRPGYNTAYDDPLLVAARHYTKHFSSLSILSLGTTGGDLPRHYEMDHMARLGSCGGDIARAGVHGNIIMKSLLGRRNTQMCAALLPRENLRRRNEILGG